MACSNSSFPIFSPRDISKNDLLGCEKYLTEESLKRLETGSLKCSEISIKHLRKLNPE